MENISKIKGYELLSKRVYRILKEKIIKGTIKPGTKLFEAKLAEKMGISRTPIREAMRELAARGFVKMIPNQGIVVSSDSIEDIQEVMQIRGALEGLAAHLATTKITEEEISKLENFLKQMEKFTKERDGHAFGEADAKFHNIIANISGNQRLIQIRKNITEQAYRYRIKLLNFSGILNYSTQDHWKIVEALKKKDSKKAEKFSQEHIENALKNILGHVIIKRKDKNKNA